MSQRTKPNRSSEVGAACALAFGIACTPAAFAADVWTGPKIIFTKANFTNPTLSSNQDCITPSVCITRAGETNARGIFNIAQEPGADETYRLSPVDTEWAFDATIADDLSSLTFKPWDSAKPPPTTVSMVGRNAVVHLISDDIYLDLKFLQWTRGKDVGPNGLGGGGFSYERSTPTVATTPIQVPVPPAAIVLALLGVAFIGSRMIKR